ncbi:hypothetical protein [Acidocella sp.]|uniref:hypothetical protein n=1 Tax=Acidocella sp. TaxID=50710 RepID=UPI00261F9354|nr:hypothetical protein [Acidocella sp.]MDD2795920.1 hypothetical protein [Acidocella sp.]
MRRFLCVLVLASLFWLREFVHPAMAASPDWDGPACSIGAASFVVCSQEPSVPGDMGPCYVSRFANYSPDPVQLDLIAICQAAKRALSATPDQRANALTRVVGLGVEINAEIRDAPSDAENSLDALKSISHDYDALGGSIVVYSSSQSDDDWSDVENNLLDLETDAQVWGD